MRRATTWAAVAVLLAACSPADGPQQATNGVDSEAGDFSAELAANAPASARMPRTPGSRCGTSM